MAAAAKQPSRCRISVVGLSGKDKGQLGVGKSCLCNRFVRPSQNEFREDHISQFGNSDWMSLVINNQHFLYWGAVEKKVSADSDRTVLFDVVEQTEFEDDGSFKPFGVSGGNNYVKRAAATKLSSTGKLMYVNKDQIALPTDYAVESFPQKFVVDGFLVVCDVSKTQYRPADRQINLLAKLLPILVKQKKPIVFAATKCDDLSQKLLDDLETAIVKHARGSLLVQTSALEAVNVDAAFFLLEQLQTQRSSRFLGRIPNYAESARLRLEEKEASRRIFERLLEVKVTDFRVTWNRAQKVLVGQDDFEQFVALAGTPATRRAVMQYVKRLQSEKRAERLTHYQQLLPDVLMQVLSSDARGKSLLSETSTLWRQAKEELREMGEFERHFVVLPDDCHWYDDENLVSTDARIPADILEEDFAKNSFDSLRRKAKLLADQEEVAGYLRTLLNEWQDRLAPGMDWTTASQILMSHPRYRQVPETVALPTFEKFEQELRESCRSALGELLLERIDLFDSLSGNQQPTGEHLQVVEEQIKNEAEYTRLDQCPSDRTTVLWNTVASFHRPQLNGDICHAIGRLHSEKTWMSPDYKWFMAPDEQHINVVLLGMDQLPYELNNEIEGCKSSGRIRLSHHEDSHFDLTVKIINTSPLSADAFVDDDFAPQGIIGVFSSPESVEYLQRVLCGVMLHAPLQSALDPVPFRGLPCALVNAVDHQKPEVDHLEVEANGQRLAYRLQCPVISGRTKEDGKRVTALQAIEAVSSLINGVKHRHASLYSNVSPEPDLKIALCCLANDQIYAERVLGPFLRHQCCWRPSSSTSTYTDTLFFEMCFGRNVRLVQIKVHSSMSGEHIAKDLKHGVLVVHSTARKASLVVAKLLLGKLPAIPRGLVSVTTSEVTDETSAEFSLLTESTQAAAQSNTMALVAGPAFQFDEVAFADFLNEAWDRREASIQTQKAPAARPRCNTPAAMTKTPPQYMAPRASIAHGNLTNAMSHSGSASSMLKVGAAQPLVHKHPVFDDFEALRSSSSSSFRTPARPHSMSFETPSRGSSLDFNTDSTGSGYDLSSSTATGTGAGGSAAGAAVEYVVVPGTTTGFVFSNTPGRTSPRPHPRPGHHNAHHSQSQRSHQRQPHGRKVSAPSLSVSSSAEALGETSNPGGGGRANKSGIASIISRGLGTLPRARSSKSPSATSYTSDSGTDDVIATEAEAGGDVASPEEAFYADPADAIFSKHRPPSHRSAKTSSGSSATIIAGVRTLSQVSAASSTSASAAAADELDEYSTPADARISLASSAAARASTASSASARASSDMDDYANPWDNGPPSRPASSDAFHAAADADSEYRIPADVRVPPSSAPTTAATGKAPPSPLAADKYPRQDEEYAVPADVMAPKRSPASLRGDRARIKRPAPQRSTTTTTTTTTAGFLSSGPSDQDEYAFPHEVLRPKLSDPGGKSSTLPSQHRTSAAASAAASTAAKPPPAAKPAAGGKPGIRSKPWMSLSLRGKSSSPAPPAKAPPAPLAQAPAAATAGRRDGSPLAEKTSGGGASSPKENLSPRDAIAALSKDILQAHESGGSPLTKARKAPKPLPLARAAKPEQRRAKSESHEDVSIAGAAAAGGGGAGTKVTLARALTVSGSPQSSRHRVAPPPPQQQQQLQQYVVAHPSSSSSPHDGLERRSSAPGSVASSCGSDSVLSSDGDEDEMMPTVSRAQLQRNATGIRGPDEDDLSISREVEQLYALTASQVGPNVPPPAPPLPEMVFYAEGQEPRRSLEEEIRRRRKNSLNKMEVMKMYNRPMVNEGDSDNEAPPPVPPKLYSFSESEEDEENLTASTLEMTKSGEGKVSTLMRKALQRPKLSKEDKERRRTERDVRREEKRRKTKRWKREEGERMRQEANTRYSKIFKSSLQESPTRGDDSLVPMFVEICVEFVEQNGLGTEGLYRVSGNKLEVDHLREQYAYAPGVAPCCEASCITVVTSALKSFFHMLSEPLIPPSLYESLATVIDSRESLEEQAAQVRDILGSSLPAKEMAVLCYMVRHLHRVSQNSDQNKMSARNLSIVFSPNFTQPPLQSFSTSLTSSLSQVVALMIVHHGIVFATLPEASPVASPAEATPLPPPSPPLLAPAEQSAGAAAMTSPHEVIAYEMVTLAEPGSRPASVCGGAMSPVVPGSPSAGPEESAMATMPATATAEDLSGEGVEMYATSSLWGAK